MKHFPPIATSLIFVAVLIVFARYDKQALPVQEESVNEGATFQGSSIIEVNGLLGDANEPTGAVTSVVPDVVSNLLAEAGTESVGGTLRLPNPLGPPLAGIIAKIKQENRDVYEVSGRLEAPQAGWFFLRRQLQPGKAGSFVGLIDIVSENRVLQLTASEVRSLPRPEVVCMGYPAREADHEEDVDFVSGAFLASVMPGVDVNAIPIPAYQNGVVPLQSLRGAKAVIYLDYDGESVSSWGGVDAAGYAISPEELLEVWERVAEDYLPFNINVTTDEAVYLAAAESSRVRCIVTPTTDAAPGAGGVAYLNSFNWEGDVPCWAFYRKGKNAAEVISHEVGHTLGLSHDGIASPTQTTSYYSGHGSGNTGWAPIMGVGYYGNLSQWSKGEYAYANNTQDDLQIITSANNDVAYRADDHGNTRVAGTSLEIYPDDSVASRGRIEQNTDVDAFVFTSLGGSIAITAAPLTNGPNLDLSLTLVNASNTVVFQDEPVDSIQASISGTLAAGEYALLVKPSGKDDATTGHTTYGSLGHYEITGTVANAILPTRLAVAEHSPGGTVIGTVSVDNPNGAPLNYTITSGNVGNTFTITNQGSLSVQSNALLDYETEPFWDFRVSVVNTLNAAYNVTNHRVVVMLDNVNEAPSFVGSAPSRIVLEGTKIGTELYQASAQDVDVHNVVTYSIISGDPNGAFAIDPSTGRVTVNGALSQAVTGSYTLTLQVADSATPALTDTQLMTITIGKSPEGLVPGTIHHTTWQGISGIAVSDLLNDSRYPDLPTSEQALTAFEGPTDAGDNFGVVMRGYLIPPVSGAYTFWMASDDQGELYLSSDNDPAHVAQIARVPDWTYVHEWDYYSQQQSPPKTLVAGQAYYIEARMKEGSGDDNIAVAWQAPGGSLEVIPGLFLAPYLYNYAPTLNNATFQVYEHAMEGVHVGTLVGQDLNQADALTYTILSGNEANIFELNAHSGALSIANASALYSLKLSQYVLSVRVSDSGIPSRSADAIVTVNVLPEGQVQTTALVQEIWDDIEGSSLTDLLSNARYPHRSDRVLEHLSFDTGKNLGDRYASRIRAYLTPTASGNYTFSLTSDDASELWLSTDSDPANATRIAWIDSWASFDQWTKVASQTSAPLALVAGTAYYIETRHKEGGGGDHVRVAWTGGNVSSRTIIDGSFLSPVDINQAPVIATTLAVETANAGGTVGSIEVSDSLTDTHLYVLLPGKDAACFSLDRSTGTLTLVNPLPLQVLGTLEIDVQVQDDGMGGRFSPRTSQSTVRVVLHEAPSLATAVVSEGLINAARNPGAVASQTTTAWSGDAMRAIDGSVSADFSSGSITHSAGTQANEAWQVELGDPCQIYEICIYNRGETLGYRLSNFEVCVYLNGEQVWAQACHTDGDSVPDGGLLSLSGFRWLRGDTVRIRLLGDTPRILSLAEVEVYASESPTGVDAAYDRWAEIVHQLDPIAAQGLSDTDADGMQNLYEFAVNADPTTSESDAGIDSETVEDNGEEWVEVQFRRRRDHSDIGLDYVVEFSESLTETSWSSVSAAEESSVTPNSDGITETVTVRCQLPLSGNRQRLFARLMVTDD